MKERRLAAVLGLSLAVSGCIAAAEHRGEPLAGWPPPAGPKTLTVNLISVVDPRQKFKMDSGIAKMDQAEVMKMGMRRAWSECPGLTVSERPDGDWDRRVVLTNLTKLKDEGKTNTSLVLYMLTGSAFPAIWTMDIQISAKVYDGEGRELGTFFQRGDETVYFSFLYVFVFPVWMPSKAYEDECYELMRRILLDARRAGAL